MVLVLQMKALQMPEAGDCSSMVISIPTATESTDGGDTQEEMLMLMPPVSEPNVDGDNLNTPEDMPKWKLPR